MRDLLTTDRNGLSQILDSAPRMLPTLYLAPWRVEPSAWEVLHQRLDAAPDVLPVTIEGFDPETEILVIALEDAPEDAQPETRPLPGGAGTEICVAGQHVATLLKVTGLTAGNFGLLTL